MRVCHTVVQANASYWPSIGKLVSLWGIRKQASTNLAEAERAGAGTEASLSAPSLVAPHTKLPILDGWRATSILLVLGAHLLPLGPSVLKLNHTAGAMGMALFFALSGFLITRFLAKGMEVSTFLLRRCARIVPLAWMVMFSLFMWNGAEFDQVLANFLFYANLPPAKLFHGGEHLWSICVEMQFYVLAAALCIIPNRKGLYLLPVICVIVTMLRVSEGAYISIYTWQRVDEILAGATIALIYIGWGGDRSKQLLGSIPFWPSLIVLVATSHPMTGALQYLRPYAAAALVAGTLMTSPPKLVDRALKGRLFAYIAEISYALYMIHGVLMATWLAQGDTVVRYIKKPFLFLLTFGLAHVSTRYFERPILRAIRKVRTASKGESTALPEKAAH